MLKKEKYKEGKLLKKINFEKTKKLEENKKKLKRKCGIG